MKNKKLNLKTLHVTSFVTSLEKESQLTLKGGVTETCGESFDRCRTLPLNDCAVPSYNRTCPTIPVTDCDVRINTADINQCLTIAIAHSVPVVNC
jgi:hypothetical protein